VLVFVAETFEMFSNFAATLDQNQAAGALLALLNEQLSVAKKELIFGQSGTVIRIHVWLII
jgi:hypothetical protein